ncbi:MAG: hypothetical protein QOD36_1437 [Mycobacterium sp.]|jgi:hypothetical protein|nr:hypothetical protein [Mycobacterium sp.]
MTQALVANGRAHTVAKSQTLRSRGIQDRQARATTADHVIYRYDPRRTPCLTYHSISGGLTGGANTLAEARESYRQLARIQRQGVPPAVEHLETALAGMWVRAKVAAAHRDPSTDQMFLLTLLSEGSAQDALRASLAHATSFGFNPVVVVVEPDETVSAVLDQTRTDDTLFVVHSDAENILRWIAINGPDAAGSRRAPLLMDRDRLRAMPIKDLTQAYSVGPQELRLQSSQLRDVQRQVVRLKGEACV